MTIFGGVHVDIDWAEEGFGSATDAQSDVYNLTCSRGIGSAAQEGFVAAAGDATVTLINRDGKYSRHNTASALYPNVRGKKPIRLRLSSPLSKVFWVGRIDKIRAGARIDGAPTVVLSCKGNFIRLTDGRKVTPTSNPGDTTDVLLASLLEAAGIATSEQALEVGEITSGVWAPVNVGPLDEVRRIVATELGRFYEAADGSFTFENRHYRRDTTRSNSVQLTLSDDPGDSAVYRYRGIDQSDPEENIYDRIVIDFTPVYTVDGSPVAIWQLGGPLIAGIIIPPGDSRTVTINPFAYPFLSSLGKDLSQVAGQYIVTVWEDPTVSGGDPDLLVTDSPGVYAAQASLSISNIVTNAHSITFTLSNSDPTLEIVMGIIRLRGERGVTGAPVKQVIGAGYREYPLPGPYYPEAGSALTAARWLYDYYSAPRDLLTLNLSGVRSPTLLTALMNREISDRIHVQATESHTNLALDDDFFLEGVAWQFQHGGDLDCTLTMSACLPNTHDTESDENGLPTGAEWYYTMNQASGDVADTIADYDLTRNGTVTDPGIIGPGQKFVFSDPDTLVQASAGPLDVILTQDWEVNGWVKRHSTTADDQVIWQKDLGDQAAARLSLSRTDATHFYLEGLIHTEDGDFTVTDSSLLIPVDTWCFVRLMHDSVAKTLAVTVGVQGSIGGMVPPVSVTYTGTPVSTQAGMIFGGVISAPGFTNGDLFLGIAGASDIGGLWPSLYGTVEHRDGTTGALLETLVFPPDATHLEGDPFCMQIGADGKLYVGLTRLLGPRGMSQVSQNYLDVFDADGVWEGQVHQFGNDNTYYVLGLSRMVSGDLLVQTSNAPDDVNQLTTGGTVVDSWSTAANVSHIFELDTIPLVVGSPDVIYLAATLIGAPTQPYLFMFDAGAGTDTGSPVALPTTYALLQCFDIVDTVGVLLVDHDGMYTDFDLVILDSGFATIDTTYPFFSMDPATDSPAHVQVSPDGTVAWAVVGHTGATRDLDSWTLYKMVLATGVVTTVATGLGSVRGFYISREP